MDSRPKCQALYDFAGEQAGDLAIKKGDIIYVDKQEGDWWEGELNGKKGPFPATYVQLI